MTMSEEFKKLPRLYVEQDLSLNASVPLGEGPLHYFRSVLRKQTGDKIRVFNGRDGEFIAEITALDKKSGQITPSKKIHGQPAPGPRVHLLFALIKKARLDYLIEKAVELGATDLHPIVSAHCELRQINEERIKAQITEAAEQCERMEMPILHPLFNLKEKLAGKLPAAPVLWCAERTNAPFISIEQDKPCAFLIGPEGGFDAQETALLTATPGITPVSLGNTVYRAETTSFICLALAGAARAGKL